MIKNILLIASMALFLAVSSSPLPYEEVTAYAHRPIKPRGESEQLCQIAKTPIYFSYFNNALIGVRFAGKLRENPILRIDSLGPTLYRFTNFTDEITVDLRKKDDLDAFVDFNRSMIGFTPFERYYECPFTHHGEHLRHTCDFYVEYPDESSTYAKDIQQWLASLIDHTTYWDETVDYPAYAGVAEDKQALSRHFADRFFYFADDLDSEETNEIDMRAYAYTKHYITYQQYTYCYLGGAHGYFTERLYSYNLDKHCEVTLDNLFKSGSKEKVRRLVQEAALQDEYLRYWSTPQSVDDITLDDISRIGLTPNGVVFSFYPYELSCFAAGCFHFTVPYYILRDCIKDDFSFLFV